MAFARLVLTAVLGPPMIAGALICALAAGLAQLGRRSPAWDVLTHAAPLYLAGGLVTLAAALVFHDRYRAFALAFGALAVLAALLLIAPEYLRSAGPRASAAAPGQLKLIQLNTWGGQGGSTRIAAWLAAQQPDIVVTQETSRKVRDAIVAKTGLVMTLGRSNVAIFSRAAPLSVISLEGEANDPMVVNGAVFQTAAGPATILGAHYPWPTEYDRLARAPELVALVRRFPSATTILAGDFNSTPWSFARRREDEAFGLMRRTRAMFSWPAGHGVPLPLLPIDHVYAGSGWATVSVTRGPNIGSDHFPIVVVLAPTPAAKP